MVTVTDTAARKIQDLMAREGKQGFGIRLAVAGGGCSGLQYELAFEEKPEPDHDEVVRFDGFEVFIGRTSAPYLRGAEIDYVETLQGAGFKVHNPNATSPCGCGESFHV